MVFYYHEPIGDLEQLYQDAQEAGVVVRGPAQDRLPILVLPDGRFKLDVDHQISNDASLDRIAKPDYANCARGYSQALFFRAYLSVVSQSLKDPSQPYKLTAVDLNWEEYTAETKKAIEWLKGAIRHETGLDTRVLKLWAIEK